MPGEDVGDPATREDPADALLQSAAVVRDLLERGGLVQNLEGLLRGGEGYRVRSVGPPLGNAVGTFLGFMAAGLT